jgi:putative salt-induced outer membrane protein YdiY
MMTRIKIWRLALFALLFTGVAAQAQTNSPPSTNAPPSTNHPAGGAAALRTPTNAVPKPPVWKSSIALGLTLARGNTDTTQASIAASTEKQWSQNYLRFVADALYGESRPPNASHSSETAEVLHGASQFNHSFWENFFAYARVDGFHDGIADIKYRLTLSPGIGYYFVTNKTFDVSLEGGPGYIKEQLDGESESFATLRLAQKLHYAISPHARLWDVIEFLPQINRFNNYLVNAELGCEAGLSKSNTLSLRAVLQDSYNNVPAAGRLRNDLKLITSVVYKF